MLNIFSSNKIYFKRIISNEHSIEAEVGGCSLSINLNSLYTRNRKYKNGHEFVWNYYIKPVKNYTNTRSLKIKKGKNDFVEHTTLQTIDRKLQEKDCRQIFISNILILFILNKKMKDDLC